MLLDCKYYCYNSFYTIALQQQLNEELHKLTWKVLELGSSKMN